MKNTIKTYTNFFQLIIDFTNDFNDDITIKDINFTYESKKINKFYITINCPNDEIKIYEILTNDFWFSLSSLSEYDKNNGIGDYWTIGKDLKNWVNPKVLGYIQNFYLNSEYYSNYNSEFRNFSSVKDACRKFKKNMQMIEKFKTQADKVLKLRIYS